MLLYVAGVDGATDQGCASRTLLHGSYGQWYQLSHRHTPCVQCTCHALQGRAVRCASDVHQAFPAVIERGSWHRSCGNPAAETMEPMHDDSLSGVLVSSPGAGLNKRCLQHTAFSIHLIFCYIPPGSSAVQDHGRGVEQVYICMIGGPWHAATCCRVYLLYMKVFQHINQETVYICKACDAYVCRCSSAHACVCTSGLVCKCSGVCFMS